MSQFRRSNVINLTDLFRALPNRPGERMADKLATQMLTHNQAPKIIKEGRAKTGSVACNLCGHNHAAGSICAYSKSMESLGNWLEKANTGPNRYHYGSDDPKRGENGTFATRAGKKAAAGGKQVSGEEKPKTQVTQKEDTESALNKPEGARSPEVGPSVQEDPSKFWQEAEQEWGATPSRMAAREERLQAPPEQAAQSSVDPFGQTQMAGAGTAPGQATKMERPGQPQAQSQAQSQSKPEFMPWHKEQAPQGIDPAHHKSAQQAAKQSYDANYAAAKQSGVPHEASNEYANQAAHSAYGQHLYNVQNQATQQEAPQFLGSQQGQVQPSVNPRAKTNVFGAKTEQEAYAPTMQTTTPPMTAGTAAGIPSAMPGQPSAAPEQPQVAPTPTPNQPQPNKPPTNTLGHRIAGMLPSSGQAYGIGAGLGSPGGTIAPTAGALAQPVHGLLKPVTQPKQQQAQTQDTKPKTAREAKEQTAHLNSLANYGQKYGQPKPLPTASQQQGRF